MLAGHIIVLIFLMDRVVLAGHRIALNVSWIIVCASWSQNSNEFLMDHSVCWSE